MKHSSEQSDEGLSMNEDRRDDPKYKVVVNLEEQYSIWAADRPNPRGWRDAARIGSKTECLAFIREVWTDMRPLSLQNKMGEELNVLDNSNVRLNGNPNENDRN